MIKGHHDVPGVPAQVNHLCTEVGRKEDVRYGRTCPQAACLPAPTPLLTLQAGHTPGGVGLAQPILRNRASSSHMRRREGLFLNQFGFWKQSTEEEGLRVRMRDEGHAAGEAVAAGSVA